MRHKFFIVFISLIGVLVLYSCNSSINKDGGSNNDLLDLSNLDLPYAANIQYANLISSELYHRYCTNNASCSDKFFINISDVISKNKRPFKKDVRLDFKLQCSFYKKVNPETFQTFSSCDGLPEYLSEELNDGTATISLATDKPLTFHVAINQAEDDGGSLFALPWTENLRPRIALNPAPYRQLLHNTNPQSLTQPTFSVTYDKNLFTIETTPDSETNLYESVFLEPYIALINRDTFVPQDQSKEPQMLEIANRRSEHSIIHLLTNTNKDLAFVPTGKVGSEIYALGANLGGNITLQVENPKEQVLDVAGIPRLIPNSSYAYALPIKSTLKAGTSYIKVNVDDRQSVYKDQLLVFPDKPIFFKSTWPEGSCSTKGIFSHATASGSYGIVVDARERAMIECAPPQKAGEFQFKLKASDAYDNSWFNVWPRSEKRMFHNSIVVRNFRRNLCDWGYKGPNDMDTADNNHKDRHEPYCAVSQHPDDKTASLIHCYGFNTPAIYNLADNRPKENNMHFYYGYNHEDTPNYKSGFAVSVRALDPNSQDPNAKLENVAGILTDIYDPLNETPEYSKEVYLWGHKMIYMCPRNTRDLYKGTKTGDIVKAEFLDQTSAKLNNFLGQGDTYRNEIAVYYGAILDKVENVSSSHYKLSYTPKSTTTVVPSTTINRGAYDSNSRTFYVDYSNASKPRNLKFFPYPDQQPKITYTNAEHSPKGLMVNSQLQLMVYKNQNKYISFKSSENSADPLENYYKVKLTKILLGVGNSVPHYEKRCYNNINGTRVFGSCDSPLYPNIDCSQRGPDFHFPDFYKELTSPIEATLNKNTAPEGSFDAGILIGGTSQPSSNVLLITEEELNQILPQDDACNNHKDIPAEQRYTVLMSQYTVTGVIQENGKVVKEYKPMELEVQIQNLPSISDKSRVSTQLIPTLNNIKIGSYNSCLGLEEFYLPQGDLSQLTMGQVSYQYECNYNTGTNTTTKPCDLILNDFTYPEGFSRQDIFQFDSQTGQLFFLTPSDPKYEHAIINFYITAKSGGLPINTGIATLEIINCPEEL